MNRFSFPSRCKLLPFVFLIFAGRVAQAQTYVCTASTASCAAYAVGAGPSGQQSITVTSTASSAATVASVQVLTLGAASLDFNANAGFSCAQPLAPGASCTQSVTFTPAAPGLRLGAVVLLDASNNVLGTTYIYGIGSASLGMLVTGNIAAVAGDGKYLESNIGDGGPPLKAELYSPAGIVLDGTGNSYIADSGHNRIRVVSVSTGNITTLAGTGALGYSGDNGPASAATLSNPSGVALDGAGNLYIADSANNAIRRIAANSGIITTVAGNGTAGYTADNIPATSAELNGPQSIAIDRNGNLFIADTLNQRIRMVAAVTSGSFTAGNIYTVAGNGVVGVSGPGSGTYTGDGAAATAAGLNTPYAIAFDPNGNLFIADTSNNVIRKVDSSGKISTYAGSGTSGYGGDNGPALSASLSAPTGLTVDPAGNLYFADTQNNAIRKISSATLKISTFAGNAMGKFLNPAGVFVPISIASPRGLTLDGSGNLYFADSNNNVVRQIQSNFVALDFSTPVRQGSQSSTISQTIENDGNAPLDLASILASLNATLDPKATTCAVATPLAVDTDCVIGAIITPLKTLVFPTGVSSQPLEESITLAGDNSNTPINIQLDATALAVNSTSTTIKSSLNPSGYLQNVTFTITVVTGAQTGNLTGTVVISDTYKGAPATIPPALTPLPIDANGHASYTTSQLGVGLHSIVATFTDTDGAHFSSTSAFDGANVVSPLAQQVEESTSTLLISSQNPSSLGQNVTFTATVTAKGGASVTPDGTIDFTDGSTLLCGSVPLVAGVATCPTATLIEGSHAILATYSGDSLNQILASVSSTLNQDVLAGTTINLTSALPNPSSYGIPVTFTAAVVSNGTPAATGTVNFLDSISGAPVVIGTGTIAPATGIASFTTPATLLVAGAHSITAAYLGDLSNAPSSTSAAITQTVNKTLTATTVLSVPNPGIAGAAETLTATVTVTQGGGTPIGTVAFTDGTTSLGIATLSSAGIASISPILAPGSHAIVATYSGDPNNTGSSSPLTLAVVLANTVTTLASSNPNSYVLSPVTFTATVSSVNGGQPSGTVNFVLPDGTSLGSATLVGLNSTSSTATLIFTENVAMTQAITAVYSGDGNDNPSSSTVLSQVINTIPTVTSLGTSAAGSVTNPQVILVATVVGDAGPIPTGTVTFNSGATVIGAAVLNSSGVAILVLNLPTGTYNIVGTYGGDALHSPSVSPIDSVSTTAVDYNLTVTPASVTMATSQNATVTVTLTSNAGFADTIGLGCGSLPPGVTCHFASINAALAAGATTTVQLTIDTNNPLSGGTSASNSRPGAGRISLAGVLLPLGLLFGGIFWRFRKRHAAFLPSLLLFAIGSTALLVTGCGGFSQSSAPVGTYTIQVNGVGANSQVTHYQNVTLTITQ